MRRILILAIVLNFTSLANADLLRLCKKNSWQEVIRNIKHLEDATKISKKAQCSCLNQAFIDGKSGLVGFFLNLNKNNVRHLKTASLLTVIESGNPEILQLAFDHGLDLAKMADREMLFESALRNTQGYFMTKILLDYAKSYYQKYSKNFFDLNKHSKTTGRTILGEALEKKESEVAILLLEANASLLEAIYVETKKTSFASYLLPNKTQTPVVQKWLQQNSLKEIAKFFKAKRSNLHKMGVFSFFYFHLGSGKKRRLKKIWRRHKYVIMAQLAAKTKKHLSEKQTLEKKIRLSNPPKNICLDLCGLEECEKVYCTFADCHHRICCECATACVDHVINVPDAPLKCPAISCDAQVNLDRPIDIVIKKRHLLKLKELRNEKLLREDKSFIACQKPDCVGGAFILKKCHKKTPLPITCELCGERQCSFCGKVHKGVCSSIEDEQTGKFIKKQQDAQIIKRCPNCLALIEKNAGCNHMTCRSCKYEFCWDSLKKY